MIGSPGGAETGMFVWSTSSRIALPTEPSRVSGTCTAIWSTSQSRRCKAAQDQRVQLDGLTLLSTARTPGYPDGEGSAQRFSSTVVLRGSTSARISHTSGSSRSPCFFAALMWFAQNHGCSSLPKMNRLENSSAPFSSADHMVQDAGSGLPRSLKRPE